MWNAAALAETIRYGYLHDYGLNVPSQDVKVAWRYSLSNSSALYNSFQDCLVDLYAVNVICIIMQ